MIPTTARRVAQQNRPHGMPIMKQRWAGLGFFHWPVDPDLIASRLPHGLNVDTFEGAAWLGIVPFFMERVRPVYLPPVPILSWFHELNLRTYVYDEKGNPGVWFFSLDCNQPIAVELARSAFHLPYQHAAMTSKISNDVIHYRNLRKASSYPEAVFTYRKPISPKPAITGSLDWFLIERYTLFSADKAGQLFSGRVHHHPYQIEPMSCSACSTIPFALNGFDEPETTPVSMLCANPVEVSVFPLKRLA
ncbi:MAG: DUF2071 domain-containing protein [Armatimonadetes bacterium]|nr:DUF2071 domain-containing protein [Akkermansiaceae bacterium]